MNCSSDFFWLVFILHVFACFSAPTQNLPISLNLHQNLSPYDINGLTNEERIKATLDVETTIDEVQKLLSLDPTLPRLTK